MSLALTEYAVLLFCQWQYYDGTNLFERERRTMCDIIGYYYARRQRNI